jgi:rSAM-associated Gly-rich repeat protein
MTIKTYAGMLALLFAIAIPASAQQPPPPPQAPQAPQAPQGRAGMRSRMLGVEAALRLKQELKLSAAQQTELEALRKEIVAERQNHARDHIDLQSRLAAGLITREDVRKQFEDRRDAMRRTMEQRHERISKILTQEQQEQLRSQIRDRVQQRMYDRRGGRGFRPGQRGRGFMGRGPGGGFGFGFGPGPRFENWER